MRKLIWFLVTISLIIPFIRLVFSSSDVIILPRPESVPKAHLGALKAIPVDSIASYIAKQARKHGVNPVVALWIAKFESGYNLSAEGDINLKCHSMGLWQLNSCFWKDVNPTMAFNLYASTAWAIEHIKINPKIWSSVAHCKEWYNQCPWD